MLLPLTGSNFETEDQTFDPRYVASRSFMDDYVVPLRYFGDFRFRFGRTDVNAETGEWSYRSGGSEEEGYGRRWVVDQEGGEDRSYSKLSFGL